MKAVKSTANIEMSAVMKNQTPSSPASLGLPVTKGVTAMSTLSVAAESDRGNRDLSARSQWHPVGVDRVAARLCRQAPARDKEIGR